MEKGSIFASIRNKVATVTFSHPAANSFPSELLNRFVDTLDRLGKNDDVNVIVIKSEGDGAFCAGASFDELLAVSTEAEGKAFFSGLARLLNAMRKCPKLIVGRVQGKAVGGGVGIIAGTDYCLATEKADVKLSEFSIGIGPFVIAPAVQRKIGVAALAELTLDATNWKNAYWAKEKGLFQRVFETTREMDEALDVLTGKLAGYNPQALSEMKRILWEGTGNWETLLYENAAISGKLVLSDFTREALEKFKNK